MNGKTFKKVASLILAVGILVGALNGCSQKQESSTSSAKDPASMKGEVNILWWMGSNQITAINKMIANDWPKKYPGVKINMDQVAMGDIDTKTVLEAKSGSTKYDLTISNQILPALVAMNGAASIDSFVARDKYDLSKLMCTTEMKVKGKNYAIPVRGDIKIISYNAAMFRAAGLDPNKPPQSMDDLMTYATALTKPGQWGLDYAFGASNTVWDPFTQLIYSQGGNILDPKTNKPVFNDQYGVKALQFLCDVMNKKLADPAGIGWDYGTGVSSYLSGKSAIFDNWPARFIDARTPSKSSLGENSMAAAWWGPKVLATPWSLIMFSQSKNKDLAWEFMKYQADKDVQKQVMLLGGDCDPTNIDTMNDPELVAQFPILRAINSEFKKATLRPQITVGLSMQDVGTQAIVAAITGKMSVQAALDDACKKTQQLLTDSGEYTGK